MPDRIIREDLLESDRWLDLNTDTARLVFVQMVLLADDFGNVEGDRRLRRKIQQTTQVKSDVDATKVLCDLNDADLIRRYEVNGREFWHVMQFDAVRRYVARKCPASPWDEKDVIPTKDRLNKPTSRWQKVRRIVLERDKSTCRYCGKEATQVDHVFPRSRGGGDDLQNLVAACKPCNESKGARTPDEWSQ